jgi:hypothetical protein
MLLQADNDTIQLFPAWNKSWNVDFRLHGPDNTVIEGTLSQGALTRLGVGPISKKSNVKLLSGITFDMSRVVALDSAQTPVVGFNTVKQCQKVIISVIGKTVHFSFPDVPKSLSIIDASGRIVKQFSDCSKSSFDWNGSALRSGCYLVKAFAKQGAMTTKLVVTR